MDTKVQVRANRIIMPDMMMPPDQNDDLAPSNPFEPFPFNGGCNTHQEKPLLPSGSYSEMENMRNRHPGLKQRQGSSDVLTSVYGTATPRTIYNFSKTRVDEDYIFAQWGDGKIAEIDYDGGTQELIKTNTADQIPASWSKVRDILVHSNGVDQHQVFAGGLSVGDNICPDSTCAADWVDTKGTGWTHDAGNDEYDCSGAQAADSDIEENTLLTSGSTYIVSIEVKNWAAGVICPVCGTQEGTDRGVDGVFTESIVGNGTTFKLRGDSAFTGSVTNIYIREKVDATRKGNYVDGFITYNGAAAALPRMPDDFIIDESIEATNDDTTAVSLDGLGITASAYDCILVRTPVPADSFYFNVGTVNSTTTTVLTVSYWQDDNDWNLAANFSDETNGFQVDGFMIWDRPTDEVPSFKCGQSGFWYKISIVTAAIVAATVLDVNYGSGFNDIQNVWDGIAPYAVEVERYDHAEVAYSTYASDTIMLRDFGTSVEGAPGTWSATADYVYFDSADPVEGIYVDVGDLPNKSADSAEPIYLYYWDENSWVNLAIFDGTDELSKSGWITFPRQSDVQPRQFKGSKYYNYWYCLTIGVEVTNKDHATDDDYDMVVSFLTMPYFDISEHGKSIASGAWKDRACYSFDRWPSYIYVTKQNQPLMLNGSDYGILQAGDGRMNKVLAITKFVNEIMLFQEETGEEGGCVTIFEGYTPATFGRLVLTSKVGILNGKCVEVVDGVLTSTKTDERVQTIAYWISRYGVFASDGRTVYAVSDPIGNYFDPGEDECIRKGYEDQHWLSFDSKDNVLRLGLVSGSSATTPNVFPVFDIVTSSWSFDVYAEKQISCMTEIEAPSGSVTVLQVAGGTSSGQLFRMNTGDMDEGDTAIESKVRMEINSGGYMTELHELMFRVKANEVDGWVKNTAYSLGDYVQAVGTTSDAIRFECTTAGTSHATVEPTWDRDVGDTTSDGTVTWTCRTHTMKFSSYQDGTKVTDADTYSLQQSDSELAKRHRFNENIAGDNLAVEFKNDTKNASMQLFDVGLNLKIIKWQ